MWNISRVSIVCVYLHTYNRKRNQLTWWLHYSQDPCQGSFNGVLFWLLCQGLPGLWCSPQHLPMQSSLCLPFAGRRVVCGNEGRHSTHTKCRMWSRVVLRSVLCVYYLIDWSYLPLVSCPVQSQILDHSSMKNFFSIWSHGECKIKSRSGLGQAEHPQGLGKGQPSSLEFNFFAHSSSH